MIQKYNTKEAEEKYKDMRRIGKRIGRNLDHTLRHAEIVMDQF
jgi:hypothetical protein